jgi:isochorismate synthase
MLKEIADFSFINHCLKNNRIFAAYCQPEESEFTLVLQKDQNVKSISSVKEFDSEHGFVFAPFDVDSSHKTIIIKDDYVLKEGEKLPEVLLSDDFRFPKALRTQNSPYFSSRNEYIDQFNIFHNHLTRHTIHKIVLSRIIPYEIDSDFDVSELFRELNNSYSDAFTFIVNTPDTGCWVGATPEQFLRIEGEMAHTVSLAGTQKDNGHPMAEVLWNTKEIAEQQYVSDYIESVLEHFIHSDRLTTEKQTMKAGSMLHLKTLFSFPSTVVRKNIGKFIDMLHPTPAVCGLPKFKAMDMINNTEIHDREYYCGFLGPMNMGDYTDLYVNLRCLKVFDNQLALYSGGGITIDSKADNEWDETILKSNTLLSVLNEIKLMYYEKSRRRN